jgi:hypothetical protein
MDATGPDMSEIERVAAAAHGLDVRSIFLATSASRPHDRSSSAALQTLKAVTG